MTSVCKVSMAGAFIAIPVLSMTTSFAVAGTPGITITSSPGTITSFSGPTTISYTLTDVCNGASTVDIFDSDGQRVHSFGSYNFLNSIGTSTTLWNGIYSNGTPVPPGYYTISATFNGTVGVPGTEAYSFNYPDSVAVDSSGNIYVADTNYQRIHVYNALGVSTGTFGSFGTGDGQFINPAGIEVDGSGNIYVVDSVNSRIQVFSPSGTFSRALEWYGHGGYLNWPAGITVDDRGNIYVATDEANRVVIFYAIADTTTVYVDRSIPVTTAVMSRGAYPDGNYECGVKLALEATDAGGIHTTIYNYGGENWTHYTGPLTFDTEGTYTIYYWSIDNVGNEESDKSFTFNVTHHQPPITINYIFDPANRQVSPTATIAPTGTITPTPAPTVTPTTVPTTTPVPAPAESGTLPGYLVWLSLIGVAIIAIVAGGYFLFFRK